MEPQKRAKPRTAAGLGPLTPEARDRLDRQVAQVAAALAAGAEVAALTEQVTPDPQDPNWDGHLMASLGALGHPAIPALLAALFGEARDKLRRKALKRTLHLLKTRGVAVPGDLLPREEASVGAPRPGTVAVYVSPIFGNGESYVILEGPPEVLGGNFLVARVSDREGFKECVLLSLKRKQQAEFWEHFREQGLMEWISPPPAYAVWLLEEAYGSHPDAGSGASQYAALREKIFQHWAHPEAAPDLEAAPPALPPGEHTRVLEQSRKLALDPLFHSWLPGPEEIAPWLQKLQEVQDSPLVLSDQQKQVRSDAVLDEATRALYPLESRADWRRRLLVTSYYLELKGRKEDSRAARAAAADLETPDRSALTGENPFLKGLVQYAVHLAWEIQQPQESPASSGLVAPPGESLLIRR
jgi:hypothetical protein